MATERLFAELASQAGIPAGSYAVGDEVEGALCLVQTEDVFEVFHSANGARHESQVFGTEEAACFYLFGVLAAESGAQRVPGTRRSRRSGLRPFPPSPARQPPSGLAGARAGIIGAGTGTEVFGSPGTARTLLSSILVTLSLRDRLKIAAVVEKPDI